MALRESTIKQEPIKGMRDSLSVPASRLNKAFLMENVYPSDPETGAAVVGRPGFTQMGAQLGAGGAGQRVFQFTQLDGTERTVGFVGGLMYTYDWGADSWSQVTLVGVSLPASGEIFCATYNDKLIVNPNDGTNRPFSWDGTTFVSLTDAPLAFGRIAVYYAKLFFINWADRSEFMWSEEASETTGYDQGGFNNAWSLQQTDQEPLFALYGTNEALYYFRARSTGAVSGPVSTEFIAAGTREGVSETIGTTSPGSVFSFDNEIYFIDADGKPRILSRIVSDEHWQDLETAISAQDKTKFSLAQGVAHTDLGLALLGIVDSGSIPNKIYALNLRTQEVVAKFSGFPFNALDVVKNADKVPTLVHLSNDGYAYRHGNPSGSLWDDGLNAGSASIAHTFIGPPLGANRATRDGGAIRDEMIFDQMDLIFQPDTAMTSVAVNYITPRGTSSAQTITVAIATDTATPNIEEHKSLGLNGRGRWLMPKIVHDQAAERFGLISATVQAFDDEDDPDIP